jgi:hypothetical protein
MRSAMNILNNAATTTASIAISELHGRIAASGLETAYGEMAFDLCLAGVPLKDAFGKIQEKALEQIVSLLDSRVLEDEAATKACLEIVSAEADNVAWRALESGSTALREGLTMLDDVEKMEIDGFVN